MRKRAVWHSFIQRPICWTACLGLSQEVIPKLITQVLGNSGLIYALCHPTVVPLAPLLYLLNFSIISAAPFSCLWYSPTAKPALLPRVPPMYPPSFLICLVAKRQPMSQLREARVSWPTSWLSSEPLPISFHQEGRKSLSLIPEQLIIKNL